MFKNLTQEADHFQCILFKVAQMSKERNSKISTKQKKKVISLKCSFNRNLCSTAMSTVLSHPKE